MKKEWVVSGGICFIIGLLFFLSRSFWDSDFIQFLYGSGLLIIGGSILWIFIGLAYPKKE